jgi:hypothetical protein
VGGGGLLLAGLFHGYHVLVILLLSIAIAGVMAARPPFWAMPSDFFTGAKAAAGIAAINSIGNLGGFLGPYLIGWARETTGSCRPHDFSSHTLCLRDVCHLAASLRETFSPAAHNTLNPTSIRLSK